MSEDTAKKPVVTRIAPSPTGHLHIGTARTALFNYLFARKEGGTFIIRTEDTDRARSTKEFEDEILEGLAWLGLTHDMFARQSERAPIHKKYLERLVEEGSAYISREESKQNPGEMVELVRLKNPGKNITFTDEIRGEITFDTTELGDMIIARAIDDPLYHFAVVADDFDMGVTHVIRGEDHISNTPRQILIQEALGAPRPVYAHLPLILAPDRSKLSKRHGAVSLNEYRHAGYLKEAIVNYLGLLGWNPGTDEEIFSLDELAQRFVLTGVQKGGAIFNTEKLTWFNREHLKRMSDDAFLTEAVARLPEDIASLVAGDASDPVMKARFARMLPTLRERVSVFSDITLDAENGEYDYAFFTPTPTKEMLAWKKDASPNDAVPRLSKVLELIAQLSEDADIETIRAAIFPYAEETGKGEVLWPLRVALSGKEKSPDPFTLIYILGITEATKRIAQACATIEG